MPDALSKKIFEPVLLVIDEAILDRRQNSQKERVRFVVWDGKALGIPVRIRLYPFEEQIECLGLSQCLPRATRRTDYILRDIA